MAASQMPSALKDTTFECGDLIIEASPFAHIISLKQNGKFCDFCALPPKANRLRCCSACKYEHYCDQQCQKKAWKYHKFECPLIRARLPRIPADSVRLLTKILWNLSHEIYWPEHDPKWRSWHDLCHHSHALKTDEVRSKQWAELSFTVIQYVGPENLKKHKLFSSPHALIEFGRMVFNGYTLTYMCEEIGAAVYVSPSIFNHSCRPNACHMTVGTRLYVRALQLIDTSKEHIFVNYIDPMQRKEVRQATLLNDYYFHCDCIKCSDTNEALLEATICPFCQGEAVVDIEGNQVCQKCKKRLDSTEYLALCKKTITQREMLCQQALQKDLNIAELERFVTTQRVLSANNVVLSTVKQTLYAFLCQFGEPLRAYDLGCELAELHKLYYPAVYPSHGEHMFKQARLAWQLDKHTTAISLYRQAIESLKSTHGIEHPFSKTAQSDLTECELERCMLGQM